MDEDVLIRARRTAERAVKGMDEGPLKTAAFQTILSKLLADWDAAEQVGRKPARSAPRAQGDPGTLRGRVLALRSEGFFKTQRALSDVRAALSSRGWHYPLTTLSGQMQSLVRRRELRRERVTVGSKEVWKYSNP